MKFFIEKPFNCTGWLLIITLLGALLRIYGTLNNRVYGDEILAYERSIEYAAGEPEACYLSQAHFKHSSRMPGPLWAMFWFNTMRLGGSIESVPLVIALLNTALIPLTYLLALRMFSFPVPILSALFQALNPWAIYYSIGSYNTLLVALPSTLLLLALWSAITNKKTKHSFWIGFLPLLAFQFHGSILPMFFAALVVMIIYRKIINWMAFFFGIVSAIPFYWRYVLEESARGWHNTFMMLLSEKTNFSFGCLKVFNIPLTMMTNWCHSWFDSFNEYFSFADRFLISKFVLLFFNIISILLTAIFVYGFAVLARKAYLKGQSGQQLDEKEKQSFQFLVITLVVPLLIFFVSFQDFSSRYTIVQTALLSIIPAVVLIKYVAHHPFRNIISTMLILVFIFNAILSVNFYRYTQ